MNFFEARERRLSVELRVLASRCRNPAVTFRLLLPGMTPRDHALLTFFISLCFLHPFPMPGVSTLLGAAIFSAGGRMFLGLGPWVPKSVLDRPLPGLVLEKIFSTAGRVMKKLERLIRPRGSLLVNHPWMRSVNGAAVAGCGLLILLPLPPPTNFPPAVALLFLSIGILEEDSVFLALGYVAFALNLLLFSAIAALGVNGVKAFLA